MKHMEITVENARQWENTSKFLKEYHLLQVLRHGVDCAEVEKEEVYEDDCILEYPDIVHPFQYTVREGDIRLLSQPDRITYVVTLPWDDQHWMIVPFSHCENPATSDEAYAAGGKERGMFQQVYQLWNARPVLKMTMRNGWTVDRLSREEVENLQSHLNAVWFGKELSLEQRGKTGLPLIASLDDPRQDFLCEERKNLVLLEEDDKATKQCIDSLFKHRDEYFKTPGWTWLMKGVSPLLAASGKSYCSVIVNLEDLKYRWHVECDDVSDYPCLEGVVLPDWMTWTDTQLHAEDVGRPLLFVVRETGDVLGQGVVEKGKDNASFCLRLCYPTSEKQKLSLMPNDIVILLGGKRK